MQNYESLHDIHDQDEEGSDVLVHVAEPSRARWNHIEDLDSFFSRMYQYHQRRGFFCMSLQEGCELIQYIFIVILTIYLCYGINYPILFKDIILTNSTKVTLFDVLLWPNECFAQFEFLSWLIFIIVMIGFIFRLLRSIYFLFYFWDIKQFFNTALKINDKELDNLTWHEVQTKVRIVQIEQQMCIHKRELTELDIYHRILRQQNYLVAMVNKKLLPPRLVLPFLGEIVYWTQGLRFNIQILLFCSPFSLFGSPWQLLEDFKKPNLRHELANKLKKQIIRLAIANLILAPLIFMWLILYTFFSYAAIIRKEPGVLSKRLWSPYGKLYLRHFNELDHELQSRLTRAYRPATKYLAAFNSPILTIICEFFSFIATSILAVFIVLTLIDEDVLTVEHVLTIVTILTLLVAILRNATPDESTPWDPEKLLENVVIHTHYLPSGWHGQAHTSRIRKEFEQLFPYSFVSLIESILSPLITPYVLWFHIYPRALDFVDFFRNFTVTVVGVGDVCSFAQMDVRKHGNPDWQENEIIDVPNQYTQGEDGKVELSLMHFTCTNPSWKPPPSAQDFVKNVQIQSCSLNISQSTGDYLLHKNLDDSITTTRTDLPLPSNSNIWRTDIDEQLTSGFRPGPSSLGTSRIDNTPIHASGMWKTEGPSPAGAREMAVSATYLHNLYYNKAGHRYHKPAQETTPLLSNH